MEPSLGLAPKLVTQIFESIVKEIARSGITILHFRGAKTRGGWRWRWRKRAYVLGYRAGVALTGACADLKTDPRIREAYLGEDIQA